MPIQQATPVSDARLRRSRRRRRLLSAAATLALLAAALHSGPAQALQIGTTELVSVDVDGDGAEGEALRPAVSPDGRYVAFASYAEDLAVSAPDNWFANDVFLRDRELGVTTKVSLADDESQANGSSFFLDLSADGRYVVFQSYAGNLVTGDTNGSGDVFLRDTVAGTTTRLSVSTAGVEANGPSFSPVISDDGRYIAFYSYAGNLVVGDTNNGADVFVRDKVAGTTTHVSVATGGAQATGESITPAISGDGSRIAFASSAADLVTGDSNGTYDIFVHEHATGVTTWISKATGGAQSDGHSASPSLSHSGRYIVYSSEATTLVAGDTNGAADVFIGDDLTNTTARVSVDTAEAQGGAASAYPDVSADGRYVTFESLAEDLVAGDTNGESDVFVRDRTRGTTNRLSIADDGAQSDGPSVDAVVSGDGGSVAFSSDGALAAGEGTSADVFLVPISESVGQILVSQESDRSDPVPLAGSEQSGDVFVFAVPPDGKVVTSVEFYVDGLLVQTEANAPYDLAGGDIDEADPYDVTDLGAGVHKIKVVFVTATGGGTARASFTVP